MFIVQKRKNKLSIIIIIIIIFHGCFACGVQLEIVFKTTTLSQPWKKTFFQQHNCIAFMFTLDNAKSQY